MNKTFNKISQESQHFAWGWSGREDCRRIACARPLSFALSLPLNVKSQIIAPGVWNCNWNSKKVFSRTYWFYWILLGSIRFYLVLLGSASCLFLKFSGAAIDLDKPGTGSSRWLVPLDEAQISTGTGVLQQWKLLGILEYHWNTWTSNFFNFQLIQLSFFSFSTSFFDFKFWPHGLAGPQVFPIPQVAVKKLSQSFGNI